MRRKVCVRRTEGLDLQWARRRRKGLYPASVDRRSGLVIGGMMRRGAAPGKRQDLCLAPRNLHCGGAAGVPLPFYP